MKAESNDGSKKLIGCGSTISKTTSINMSDLNKASDSKGVEIKHVVRPEED